MRQVRQRGHHQGLLLLGPQATSELPTVLEANAAHMAVATALCTTASPHSELMCKAVTSSLAASSATTASAQASPSILSVPVGPHIGAYLCVLRQTPAEGA